MIVVKDGITMNLENESHVAAFLSSGWAEAKASVPATEEEKIEEKATEPVTEPVEAVSVAEPEVKVATAPKRGRKKQEK